MDPQSRREMYACNITYGTASEFGFDYLRDNWTTSRKKIRFSATITSVSLTSYSILVDEARTPLIISGPMQDDNPLPFNQVKPAIKACFLQQAFCNKLVAEAKKVLEDESSVKRKNMPLPASTRSSACRRIAIRLP